MKILLHICCGPCAIFPLGELRAAGLEVQGYFFNPNIHPYQEWQRRLAALEDYAGAVGLPLIVDKEYNIQEFLRQVAFREAERCRVCYHLRLTAAARAARETGCDAFTTTLLYSKYQQHDRLREMSEQAGREAGVAFHYEDFRVGWRHGVDESKRRGMYRQPYCGCLYSERERYYREG